MEMKLISEIVTIAILATLAMTAMSYVFTYIFKGNFKEPQLLNCLIDRLPKVNRPICSEHIYGWSIHFFIGILFVILFKICLFYNVADVTLKAGAIFGFLAGVVGVAGWITFFSLHPDPPSINKVMFYSQLIFVHIIFGIVMVQLMGAV